MTNGDVLRQCSDEELAKIFNDVINRHLKVFEAALPDEYVGELVEFLGSEYVEIVPEEEVQDGGVD